MLPVIRRNSLFPSIVDEFFGKDFPVFLNLDTGISSPSVNIIESREDFRIEVAAPGLEKEDFRIHLQHNVMTISSEKEASREEKDEKFMRREFSYLEFSRSFSLPGSVDSERIDASYMNGVLSITIPKREETKDKTSREIAVS